jgi:hypothetical protein
MPAPLPPPSAVPPPRYRGAGCILGATGILRALAGLAEKDKKAA